MKRIAARLLLIGTTSVVIYYLPAACSQTAQSTPVIQTVSDTFKNHESGIQVTGEGKVVRILANDNDGLRHQRFILKLAYGQTLLIAHNIDIAPRIDSLKVGDAITFKGEYIWNEKGGIVHWPHLDPNGTHSQRLAQERSKNIPLATPDSPFQIRAKNRYPRACPGFYCFEFQLMEELT